MSETNEKILSMISKNASANEICTATGLSNKQLFHRQNMLKLKGYNFSRKYYYDGEICYKLDKGFTQDKEISLITSPNDQEFKAIFLSDLHICNEKQRLDLLNQVYDYCAKEGIHIIINGGDFIDGLLGPHNKLFKTYEQQIEYALKVHPFDKNILNFICLGNHDYSSLETTGQNLETALYNKRHDIISLGYGVGELNIKNDKIYVVHPQTSSQNTIDLKPIKESRLILYGHGHVMKNKVLNNDIKLYLPSLSDLAKPKEKGEFMAPSIIKSTIDFKNGYFNVGCFEQYIFLDKMYKVNESEYLLSVGKNTFETVVKYEEERKPYVEEKIEETKDKPKQKIIEKPGTRMSQIEKFNKRFNR